MSRTTNEVMTCSPSISQPSRSRFPNLIPRAILAAVAMSYVVMSHTAAAFCMLEQDDSQRTNAIELKEGLAISSVQESPRRNST